VYPYPHAKNWRHGDRRAQCASIWFVLLVFLVQAWCSIAASQETPSEKGGSAKMDRGFFVAKKDVENVQDRVFREEIRKFLTENGTVTRNIKGSIYYFIAEEQIDQVSDPEWKERVRRFVTDPLQEAFPKTESELYEIKPGDTLWEVARDHGMSVEELIYLNNMVPNQPIFPGQKVFVRPK